MTGHTHTLDEWFAFLSLGLAVWAAQAAVIWLIADAESLSPRRAVVRLLESEAVYPLLREWDTARHATREAFRDAAALLILLFTRPQGAMA